MHVITVKLDNEETPMELVFKHDNQAHQCLEWIVKADNLREVVYTKGTNDD